jgi:hypothetical protein
VVAGGRQVAEDGRRLAGRLQLSRGPGPPHHAIVQGEVEGVWSERDAGAATGAEPAHRFGAAVAVGVPQGHDPTRIPARGDEHVAVGSDGQVSHPAEARCEGNAAKPRGKLEAGLVGGARRGRRFTLGL